MTGFQHPAVVNEDRTDLEVKLKCPSVARRLSKDNQESLTWITPAKTPLNKHWQRRIFSASLNPRLLYIEISDPQCIVLNERATRLDHITHQCGKDFISGDTVFYLGTQQPSALGVHGSFP